MEPNKDQLKPTITETEKGRLAEVKRRREVVLGGRLIQLHRSDPDKWGEYDRLYTEYHLRKIKKAKKPTEGLVTIDEKEQILAFVKGILGQKPDWLKDEDEEKRDGWSYTDI